MYDKGRSRMGRAGQGRAGQGREGQGRAGQGEGMPCTEVCWHSAPGKYTDV